MKKIFLVVTLFFTTTLFFANEWTFISATTLQLSPINQSVSNNYNNHFGKISKMNVPIPYSQFVAEYIIPLNFGDNPIFQDANLAFIAGPTLTPITLDNQLGIVFTPSPLFNFGFGLTAATGWSLLKNNGISKYDASTDSYKALTPFKAWKYDFIAQTNFQFDFNVIFPGEWTHVITTANYTAKYEGCSAARNYEPWLYLSVENVNGWMFSSSFMLGYMLPYKLKLIGLDVSWQGHYNSSDFGIYEKTYDGGFVEISYALNTAIDLNEKNSLVIVANISGRRGFLEETFIGDAGVSKTTISREWVFNGIVFSWNYIF